MKTLLSKLFPSRTGTLRKAARPPRKPRLSIEALDDRVLPSATSSLASGVLTISAADNGSHVAFFNLSGNQWMVVYDGNSTQTFTGPINEVVFKGGAGDDIFSNQSNINDLVIGSAGRDLYLGGSGVNLLDRHGHGVSWNSTSGQNFTFGLGDGTPTAADLSATGAMTVSLSSNRTQLTIAGPSGIGFRLDIAGGQWKDQPLTNNGQTTHSFTPVLERFGSSSGSVMLHTGTILLGDIPLGPGAAGMTITTKAAPWADPVGEFSDLKLSDLKLGPGLDGILALDTTDRANATDPFKKLGDSYGIDVKLPSTPKWGLGLGRDVLSINGLTSAPLNNAVPYFYLASVNSLTGSFGGTQFSVGGPSIAAAFDPSDPFLYAAFKGGPIDIAAGASINGHIPFTPQLPPPTSVLRVPVPPPNISGNVFLAGTIPLADTPLAITGNVVVGLVHDVNGNLAAGAGLSRAHGDALLNLKESLLVLTKSIDRQPTIGVNGELDIGKDYLGGGGSISMKLGEAVAYYVPNMTNPGGLTQSQIDSLTLQAKALAFFKGVPFDPDSIFATNSATPSFASGRAFVIYAASANPWDGITINGVDVGHTIDAIMPSSKFNLQGIVDTQKNWAVHLDGQTSGLFSFNTTSVSFDASSLTKKVVIHANIKAGFGLANLTLFGALNTQTGDVTASESAAVSFDVSTFPTLRGVEELTLSYKAQTQQFSAALGVNASAGSFLGSLALSGHADVKLDSSHTLFNVRGELDVNGAKIADVSMNNTGITIVGVPIPWSSGPPGDLHPDGPALVGSPARLRFFVPQGVTDPVHFSAALSPDGLAADYAAAGTDPIASFTFAAPGTYTVYGRMYSSDGQTSDYNTTVTVYAADQADVYFVERLYHDLLGRAAEPAGLAFHTGALARGASRVEVVVGGFLHSLEYRQNVIHTAYHELLGRFAEPEGLGTWVSFLAAGGTAEALRAKIAISPEYAQLHGDDLGFVYGLYRDLLGRTGSAAEVDYYARLLAGAAGRAEVVDAFFTSAEHRTGLTGEIYQEFLRRDADPSGLWFNTRALGQGASDFEVMAGVLASPEYAPRA